MGPSRMFQPVWHLWLSFHEVRIMFYKYLRYVCSTLQLHHHVHRIHRLSIDSQPNLTHLNINNGPNQKALPSPLPLQRILLLIRRRRGGQHPAPNGATGDGETIAFQSRRGKAIECCGWISGWKAIEDGVSFCLLVMIMLEH